MHDRSTGDVQDNAGNPRCIVASEIERCVGDVRRRSETPDRMQCDEILLLSRGDALLVPLGQDCLGSNAVRSASVGADLGGKVLGENFGRPWPPHKRSGTWDRLDGKMRHALQEQGVELKPWQLRDLRRTARTLMSRAGISTEIAERALGHVMTLVRGTYDRHDYLAEKRDAFEQLATLVERIVNPPPQANVVALSSPARGRRTSRQA